MQQKGHPEEQTMRHSEQQVSRHCEKGVARRSNPLPVLQGYPGLPRSLSLPRNDGDGVACVLVNKTPHPNPLPRRGEGKRIAFTLAEVLITLGIIGVVAAMTIPTLVARVYETRTVKQLKATYSIISQAFRAVQEEVGTPGDWELTGFDEDSAVKIVDKLRPVLKIAVDCGGNDSEGRCTSYHHYQLNGEPGSNHATNTKYYKLILANGTSLIIRGMTTPDLAVTPNAAAVIYVDTNGKSSPNAYGRDFFQFKVMNDGSVYPIGNPTISDPAEKLCVKNGTGFGCTYYVLHNENMNYLHKK